VLLSPFSNFQILFDGRFKATETEQELSDELTMEGDIEPEFG
jgi:hypothetical protein